MRKLAIQAGWKPLIFLAAVLASLAILFVETKVHDTSSDFAQLRLLREIRELDTRWELGVLRSKSGIDDNYDALADPLAGLEQLLQRLEAQAVGAAGRDNFKLRRARLEIRSDFLKKSRLIETFKSHNAILRNSLLFMPKAALDFRIALHEATAPDAAGRAQMASLTNATLLDCLTFAGAPSDDAHAKIESDLDQLSKMGASLTGPEKSSLSIFVSHATKVLHEQPLVDGILFEITAIPTSAHIGELYRTLIARNQDNIRRADKYRLYLLLFSAALALLLLAAAVRLVHSNTTIRRINVALKSESEAKSRFIANVSHELRTPLSSIISYAELMREVAEEDGRSGDVADFDVIIRSARHLLMVISEILDFAKLGAGHVKVEIAEFACQDLLSLVYEVAEPLAAANGNRLELLADPDLGSLHSDQLRLRQCLLNLASNAAKFTKNGVITIGAQREQRRGRHGICFKVCDTGIGMSADVVGKLFQPFRQAEDCIARRFGGTGLGLAITRELARMLGGDVHVESSPGKGTSCRLWIPAHFEAPSAPGKPVSQGRQLPATHAPVPIDAT